MRIGFDIDGVITKHPNYFSFLTNALKREGHFVAIVTSRSALGDVQKATKKELGDLGIIFDELYFLPETERAAFDFPPELDWFQKRIWLKAHYCRSKKINIFMKMTRKQSI
jgi:hypothetical protein